MRRDTAKLRLGLLSLIAMSLVSAALAQQTSVLPAASRRPEKATVVALRVELDMLQLDHDADRASMLEFMKLERNAEGE